MHRKNNEEELKNEYLSDIRYVVNQYWVAMLQSDSVGRFKMSLEVEKQEAHEERECRQAVVSYLR